MIHGPSLRIQRSVLDNGMVLLVNKRPDSETVSARISFRAGAVFDPPDKPGLSKFVSKMIIRGTERRTYSQIIREVESAGSSIDFASGDEFFGCSIRSTPNFLRKVIEIAFDCIRNPSFPDHEIEKVRGILITEVMEREDSTAAVAKRVARENLFPEGNPYHHDPGGYLDSLKRITRQDLVGFWRKYFSPQHCVVSASGPISLRKLKDQLQRIREWEGEIPLPQLPTYSPLSTARNKRIVSMAHKSQVDIVTVTPAIPRNDPDYYALATANVILGRIGLMGRLGKAIRDRQGLAYYATSSYVAQIGTGYWLANIGVNPNNVERALSSLESEMTRIGSNLVAKSERSDAITHQIGSLSLALETTGGAAKVMQEIEVHELGIDYLKRYGRLLKSVTREDIRRVSEAFIDPERAVTAIVGPYQERSPSDRVTPKT